MSIFVCGDTHGTYDRDKITTHKWKDQRELTRDDYLIILGDAGIIWDTNPYDKSELNLIKWYNEKRMTVLIIDGNHENFERLNSFPEVEMFDNKVGKISDNIYHLKRGRIYNIDNKKIFVMGGGESIDKNRRRNRVSWWQEEMPSYGEMIEARKNLIDNDSTVDYILTHTCSNKMFVKLSLHFKMSHKNEVEKTLRNFFDWIEDNVYFKEWHFAHFHEDKKLDEKHYLWYNNIPRELI